ncbi:MAG: hypothetical protein H0W64_01020 [Gammaproteobacteria bacterium]|nr:hypothetical protein [Gammaproteobacteria bacterium]
MSDSRSDKVHIEMLASLNEIRKSEKEMNKAQDGYITKLSDPLFAKEVCEVVINAKKLSPGDLSKNFEPMFLDKLLGAQDFIKHSRNLNKIFEELQLKEITTKIRVQREHGKFPIDEKHEGMDTDKSHSKFFHSLGNVSESDSENNNNNNNNNNKDNTNNNLRK